MIVQTAPPAFRLKAIRQPMAWAAAAYAGGIWAGVHLWRPATWWVIAGITFAVGAAYFSRRRRLLGWLLALGVFFIAGALHIQLRASRSFLNTDIQPYANGQELEITAHVLRDGRLHPRGLGEFRQTEDLQTEQIKTGDGLTLNVQSGIRLSLYSRREESETPDGDASARSASASTAIHVLHYGERIRFTTKLKLARNFRNPGAFDYKGYLAERGIAALGSAKVENVELLPGLGGARIGQWRSRLHGEVIGEVHELWPAREAALLDAMLIGDEAFIDRDTRVDFQRSGTYHVLVVSGMNVSIVAFVIFWTLRRLRLHEVPATFLTIAFCVAYALVTEVGAPVWRATLMAAVYLGTRLLYRERAMVNALGATALGLLVFDPRQLFTASFQMTFLCVLIVSAIELPILEQSSQLYKQALINWGSLDYAAYLPPQVAQFRVDLQLIAGKLAPFAGEKWASRLIRAVARSALTGAELVLISVVMQMGLTLPMAYYFHRVTTIGLPANLLVVPLTQLLMPAALAALALGWISPWLAKIPVLITTLAIHGVTDTVRGLGGLRLADERVPTPSLFAMVAASASLALAIWAARRGKVVAACGLAAMLASSVLLALYPSEPRIHPGILEMTSIDVGEGDSTLLVTPQGQTLLIDAGGPIGPGTSQLDFGEDVVSPYLWVRGIRRLDAVAITHGHSDHIGGMVAVLRNFRPKELWVGLLPPSPALDEVIATAQALGVQVIRHWEGDEFTLGGATVTVLYPRRDAAVGAKPANNDSMVLRIAYRQSSVLLEGDAEKRVERYVVAVHHPSASLLKVGHHGSANATTPELVASAKPSYAVISVGMGNSFGLPRLETLECLEEAGTRVYRTDLDGAVSFYLDGRGVTPSVAALE